MPRHSHEYEKFCYFEDISFNAPSGNWNRFPCNITNHSNSSRFLYTYSTTSVGGGSSHNNMPPFLTANCWKRTGKIKANKFFCLTNEFKLFNNIR